MDLVWTAFPDQKFRVGRPGAAVCPAQIQILTEKCILRIPLSSDFLQIIGRKQIDGRIQTLGSNLKVYPRSNPTQIWPNFSSKTILLRAMIFVCE